MYCLIDFCCICFYNKEHLQPLSDSDGDNITYFIKLASCAPEMCLNEMNDQWMVCNKCCETMDAAYKFRQRCLRSKATITDYIIQLHLVGNVSDVTNVYFTDIVKFCDINYIYKKEDNIDKMSIKVNEKTDEINPITEIKRENNLIGPKIIGTEHIQFENIIIEVKREDQFFEENIAESSDNLFVNQNNIKIGPNQSDILTTNAIKIESENLDFEEHLRMRFDNIVETCDSINDDTEIKVKERYNYSLYSEKYTDDFLTNLNENEVDIVDNDIKLYSEKYTDDFLTNLNMNEIVIIDNDIELANNKINILRKSEDIKEFSTENDVFPLKNQDKTDIDSNFVQKSLEEKQNTTTISKKPNQNKNNDEINRKAKIVKKHICNICKKHFLKSALLITNDCDVCQKKFNLSGTLREHIKIHTNEKLNECSVCEKKFNRSFNLKQHMKIHTAEKLHECEVCQKKFTYSSNLRKHMRTHIEEKRH